ncbi:hypothetical protein Agabi119p4_6858 [Agaricus bisporus var. burnettii]|uniref:Uncharacterized protein n=1 Tax=Agaricus bisporus var. burnettii TaxID=192524 RepID=A0A8H7KF73_AGABI|nr:hypothetical protein Agabi119p4_6858 [Agaricus bisporus var. burnettii]
MGLNPRILLDLTINDGKIVCGSSDRTRALPWSIHLGPTAAGGSTIDLLIWWMPCKIRESGESRFVSASERVDYPLSMARVGV